VSAGDPLDRPVYATGGYKPFGDFTIADAEAISRELTAATGWGPTARVAVVARGWSELAATMTAARAATVADLDAKEVIAFARRLWVVPPDGTLL